MTADTAIIVSDLHCGSLSGLCPPRVRFDDGGTYEHSPFQAQLWEHWLYFWGEWVPAVVGSRAWALILNGDLVEGQRARTTHSVSNDYSLQARIAVDALTVALAACATRPPAAIYCVGGTEAHAGQSWEDEQRVASEIGATPDHHGARVRPDLWLRVGTGLAHCAHHIGTTGSQAYEMSALGKELVETLADAARWGLDVPDWVVRSHRHRSAAASFPTARGEPHVVVTPGWQGRTPWAAKLPGGRTTTAQFGGVALVERPGGNRHYRRYVVTASRSRTEGDA